MSVPNTQTSLFVGNLDPLVYRELLTEIFSLAGPVTQCHIVYDKVSGKSSGFGFVDFSTHTIAQSAMEKFRGRTIFDKLLTIDWARTSSTTEAAGQHCLFVGNLSPDVTDEQLQTAFSQFGDVTASKCAKDATTGKTQGFAFVTFRKREDADAAMEAMNGQLLNGRALRVDWAKGKGGNEEAKENERRTSYDSILVQTSVNNVTAYVSGLDVGVTQEEIQVVFAPFGAIREIRIPESVKAQATETMYAFVRYIDHASAARAICECQGGVNVGGRQVQVHWGRESVRRLPAQPNLQRGSNAPYFQQGFQQGFQQQYHAPFPQPRAPYGAQQSYNRNSHMQQQQQSYQHSHAQHRFRPY